MGPRRLTFEYSPLSYAYPDDESDKGLFLQAGHPRTVLLYWVNIVFDDGEEVWQVVRLDNRDGIHTYVYPDMIVVDGCEREHNRTFPLGVFTRDQREAVLECADDIAYEARSGDDGQCVRWMRELLHRMADDVLVDPALVDAISGAVPLQ